MIIINTYFIEKIYIYEKRKLLNEAYYEMKDLSIEEIIQNIEDIEKKTATTIIYTNYNDINSINDHVINKLYLKGVRVTKFWITQESIDILDNGSVNKIYDQGVAKYKLFTKFFKKDDHIFVIALSLPYIKQTIDIVNKLTFLLMIFWIILISLLIKFISYKIVRPLNKLKLLSDDIANLNFRTEIIKTNDEIEEVAKSINIMSEKLETSTKEIMNTNKELKDIMFNASHELKTPLALIKTYTQGKEDGLDDGTFDNVIYDQIDRMDILVEKLLIWAKFKNTKSNKENINLVDTINDLTNKYGLIFYEKNIKLKFEVLNDEEYIVKFSKNELEIVLENLLTNAIKYSSGDVIEILVIRDLDNVKFEIVNITNSITCENLENIWKPFYVFEESRNKKFSGTGLGLSIVKNILDSYDISYGIYLKDSKFIFYIIF